MNIRKGELLTPTGEAGGGGTTTPASQTPTTTPESAIDDPILGPLAEDLKDLLKREREDNPPDIKAVDEGAGKPAASSAAGESGGKPAGQSTTPEPLKGGVKKRLDPAKVAEEVFERKMAAIKAAPAPVLPDSGKPAASADGTPPPNQDGDLAPEQIDELADAEYAEKAEPEKFKGMQQKLRAFYKQVDEWVKEHEKDDERTFDENDEEFIKFVEQHKPQWSGQRERLRIERIADARAEQKLKARQTETDAKISEAQREAREARFMPVITSTVATAMEAFDKETQTDDPLENEVFTSFRDAAAELTTDYLRVVNGVDQIGDHNPPAVKQRHDWLISTVINQAESFSKKKPEETMRDGRRFVTPGQYAKMRKVSDPKLSEVWTFNTDDVVGFIRARAVEMARQTIKQEEERAKQRGFTKVKPAAEAKGSQQVKPINPPKATPSQSPGPVEVPRAEEPDHPGKELIATLGLTQ